MQLGPDSDTDGGVVSGGWVVVAGGRDRCSRDGRGRRRGGDRLADRGGRPRRRGGGGRRDRSRYGQLVAEGAAVVVVVGVAMGSRPATTVIEGAAASTRSSPSSTARAPAPSSTSTTAAARTAGQRRRRAAGGKPSFLHARPREFPVGPAPRPRPVPERPPEQRGRRIAPLRTGPCRRAPPWAVGRGCGCTARSGRRAGRTAFATGWSSSRPSHRRPRPVHRRDPATSSPRAGPPSSGRVAPSSGAPAGSRARR